MQENNKVSLDGVLQLAIEPPKRGFFKSLFKASSSTGLYDNIYDYMNNIVYPRVESFPIYEKLPATLDFSNELTQQENQYKENSCATWSVTTGIESILWKLTGKKREFTDAEIFNIYWDDQYMLKNSGAVSTAYSGERKTATFIRQAIQSGNEAQYFPTGSITTSILKSICEYNNNLSMHAEDAQQPSELCQEVADLIGSSFLRYGYGPDNSSNGANGNTRQIYVKDELRSFLYKFGPSIIQVFGHAMLCYGYNEKGILCRNSWGSEPANVSSSNSTQIQQAIYHNIPWENLIMGNTTVNTTFTNQNGTTTSINKSNMKIHFMDIVAFPNAFKNL